MLGGNERVILNTSLAWGLCGIEATMQVDQDQDSLLYSCFSQGTQGVMCGSLQGGEQHNDTRLDVVTKGCDLTLHLS